MATPNVENKIKNRAFEIFNARGGVHGNDIDDWLQAEREISGGASNEIKTTSDRKKKVKSKSS